MSPRFRLGTEQACSTTSAGTGCGSTSAPSTPTTADPPTHAPHPLTQPPKHISLGIGKGFALLDSDGVCQLGHLLPYQVLQVEHDTLTREDGHFSP